MSGRLWWRRALQLARGARSALRRGPRIVRLAAAAAILLFGFWALVPVVQFDVPLSTVVLDRDGELLGASIAEDGQWRFGVAETVPEKFAAAITCYEDRRFYWHPGVDPLALARAARQNLRQRRVVSGGSTLTMQVVRLSREGRPRTFGEKAIEAVLALRLTLALSKSQVLGLYAAYAPFGGNTVGLDAAAWRYFGRQAGQLSWAETATLAVLPNTPALVHPGRNRDRLIQRLNRPPNRCRRAPPTWWRACARSGAGAASGRETRARGCARRWRRRCSSAPSTCCAGIVRRWQRTACTTPRRWCSTCRAARSSPTSATSGPRR